MSIFNGLDEFVFYIIGVICGYIFITWLLYQFNSLEHRILKYMSKHPNQSAENIRKGMRVREHKFYKVFNGILNDKYADGYYVTDIIHGGYHVFSLTTKGCEELRG